MIDEHQHPEQRQFNIVLPPEFYEDLDRRIKNAIQEILVGEKPSTTRYLTRKEVCKKLSISLPTLSRYISKGILSAQKIGTRVLFDESKLDESLQKLRKK